jgi:SpoVK/Ycf46/Vps4 family AAA+-type ATPase
MNDSKQEILNTLKGFRPLIYIISKDERNVVNTIEQYINNTGKEFDFLSWDFNRNVKNLKTGSDRVITSKGTDGEKVSNIINFESSIKNVLKKKENVIQVYFDVHRHLNSSEITKASKISRSLKDFAYEQILPFTDDYHLLSYSKKDIEFQKCLIFISPVLNIPKELENLMHIIHFDVPDKIEIKDILESYIVQENFSLDTEKKEKIIEAAIGLTESEVMMSFKKSYFINDKKDISIEHIRDDKMQIIQKNGILEFIDTDINKDSIGGFDELFPWLNKRKLLFKEPIREKYNLNYPKGVMLTGIQGCGKSLAAKVIANDLDIPLLRLNMGSIFGKWLGESEQNFRDALNIAEKMSPCVLWIDEIEKSFSSGNNTHETAKRIFGYFLTWMQENELPVFLVATANKIDSLPPEFLRKGRFDEIWFINLPSKLELIQIFKVHFNKRNIELPEADLSILAEKAVGFSGAEIEAVVKESILTSVVEEKEINIELISKEIENITPLSVTNKSQIDEIRNWAAKNQVRSVSREPLHSIKKIGY